MDNLSAGCGLNITHAAVDRHAAGDSANRAALRFPADNGNRIELTYADLQEESSRFAAVLAGLGVKSGEVVASYTGRIPALYFTNLISARPLMGPAGAGSLAQVVNAAMAQQQRFDTMRDFFEDVGHTVVRQRTFVSRVVAEVGEAPGAQIEPVEADSGR